MVVMVVKGMEIALTILIGLGIVTLACALFCMGVWLSKSR